MTQQAISSQSRICHRDKLLEEKCNCRVLVYHKINDKDKDDVFTVQPKKFEQHLKFFLRNGLRTISLSNYLSQILNGRKNPPDTFVLTFDDGYEDFYRNVLPILKKYNFTATVFIVADLVGKENVWDIKLGQRPCRLMSWEQINKIIQDGIEIGSHSLTHPDLTLCRDSLLNHEIGRSKHILEKKIKRKVKFFSYPYGKFTENVKRKLIKNGYAGACTINPYIKSDKMEISRIMIFNKDSTSKIYAKME